MYDPKFEKAVQRKMEELEFRPSESVWVNIEKAVSGQRRRRVIPFFWRLLIPAVLVTVAGGAYYFGEKAGRKAAATGAIHAAEPTAATAATGPTETRVTKAATGATRTTAPMTGAPDRNEVKGQSVKTAHALVGSGKKYTRTVTIGSEELWHPVVVPKKEVDDQSAEEAKTSASGSARIGTYLYTPGLEDQRLAAGVRGGSLHTKTSLINLNSLSREKRPWEAGFTGGAGIDRLNQPSAGQAASATYSLAPSFYSLSRVPASKNTVSDVRPGASFYAGIYLQKAVSNRWVFHTGVNLHYYSTQVSVGQQVSVMASPSASLLNQTVLAAAPAPLVYTVGNEQNYTNRYYMLELPVSMQFRINRSKMLPLFLEGGGSFSRVMGANAIFYNPSTGLYLKNESVLNKTQINVVSALVVGLPFHGIRIQAGPEVQYGLTPLVNVQGLGDQHFLYTGIRLVVLPGRR